MKSLGISTLIPNPDTLNVLEDAPEHTPSASKAVKVQAVSGSVPSRLLSVLIEDFTNSPKFKSTVKNTQDERIRLYKTLIQYFKDRPVNAITKKDAQEYRDKVLDLKSKRGAKKLLSHINVLFYYAVEADDIQVNPFKGLALTGDSSREIETLPFTEAEHKRLFSPYSYCTEYRLSQDDAGKYWVPLIGFTSGARMNEICQLLIKDVKIEDDTWYLHITPEDGAKSVKTKSSIRKVPLHDSILKLGFIEYFNARKQRCADTEILFADCPKQVKHGNKRKIQRYFDDQLRVKLFGKEIINSGKSFKSLRAYFISQVTGGGVDHALRYMVVGHVAGEKIDVHIKHYNKHHSVSKVKLEVIDKFDASVLEPLIQHIKASS